MRDEASTLKKFFYVFLSIVFVMLFCGASYALWNFEFEGEFNVLEASSITMELLESDTEVISLDNAIPIPDELGKLGEAFDFMVRTETSASIGIGYNIVLEKLEPSEGYSFLRDDEVKIYLTDDNENVLLEPTFVSEISGNYVIYKKFNVHNSLMTEIKDKYKLRVWIDDGVTSDRINEESRLEYSFKLGVKTSIDSSSNSTYKVTYNANGGEGVMSDSTLTFNELESLESGLFTKAHHDFLGWSLKPNGEVIYKDSEEVSNITDVYNGEVNLYAVWEKKKYTASVVVQNGTLVGDSLKEITYDEDGIFNLSSSQGTDAIVSCTNNQTGLLENNVLTIKNISDNTVCTVKFVPTTTVLYSDGTLIINEKGLDRESNIALHGDVANEYEAMSATNSYLMTSEANQPWANERSNIINVEIGQEIKPMSTAYWFRELRNMEVGTFIKLDMSSVIDMQYMFSYAGYNSSKFNLRAIDVWNTSKVTNMQYLFDHAGYKTTNSFDIGKLTNWNVSNVTNMKSMFGSTCANSSICNVGNIGNWNVGQVTNMSYMFEFFGQNAITWSIGDLSNWDVSNVNNMIKTFSNTGLNVESWTIGNLSNWDTSKVRNMSYMFYLSGSNSTEWYIGDLSNWDVSNVTSMAYMFSITGQKAKQWDIGDLSNWNTSNVTDMKALFYYSGYRSQIFNIGNLDNWNTSKVTNMNRMFDGAGNDATTWNIGNLSKWDVSNVTDMAVMFSSSGTKAEKWDIGDLSNWNTSKVTTMARMFEIAGSRAITFSSIGTLNIPAGCNVDNFIYADTGYSSSKFIGNFVINGTLSSYTDMLKDAATNSSARINLYYKNSEAEAIVDELVSLYGPNGTVSKGNIYKTASST